jgi:hypothetical protein
MRAIAAAKHEPEIQRDERESDPLVLLDVSALVEPERVARLTRADDHVPECDGREAAHRDEQMGKPAVGDIEEAAVAYARPRERQDPDEMPERVGVMAGERAGEIS